MLLTQQPYLVLLQNQPDSSVSFSSSVDARDIWSSWLSEKGSKLFVYLGFLFFFVGLFYSLNLFFDFCRFISSFSGVSVAIIVLPYCLPLLLPWLACALVKGCICSGDTNINLNVWFLLITAGVDACCTPEGPADDSSCSSSDLSWIVEIRGNEIFEFKGELEVSSSANVLGWNSGNLFWALVVTGFVTGIKTLLEVEGELLETASLSYSQFVKIFFLKFLSIKFHSKYFLA